MPSRKAILATVVVVVLLVAAGIVTLQLRDDAPDAPAPTTTAAGPTDAPSSPAPTTTAPTAPTDGGTTLPAEPAPDDVATEPAQDDTETESGPAPSGGAVDVVITYAGWAPDGTGVEVSAYAAAVEGAGTCTLTLTKGTAARSQTIDALVDVSTMSCGGFLIPAGQVPTGTWTAVVAYSSATSTGQSNPIEVVVP
jgi:hypothetical protein